MRTVILCLLLLPLSLGSALSAHSGARSRDNHFHSTSRYRRAVSLLESGRDYGIAATLLRGVIASKPGDPELHSTLAAAYVDRASSIAYAAAFRKMQAKYTKQYPDDLAAWLASQKDRNSDEYGDPKPVLPPHREYATKDDGRPLTMTDGQAADQVRELQDKACGEWRESIALADSRAQRAQFENSYAWGLQIFDRFRDCDSPSQYRRPAYCTIEDLLHSAAVDDPKSSVYWEDWGDYLWSKRHWNWNPRSPDDASGSEKRYGASVDASISAAYERSLRLNPRNAALWLRLSLTAAKEQPARSVSLLRIAQEYAPNAAVYHYQLALKLLGRTPFGNIIDSPVPFSGDALVPQVAKEANELDFRSAQAAVAETRKGNDCAGLGVPAPVPSIPRTMLNAWACWATFRQSTDPVSGVSGLSRYRELARELEGYALVEQSRGRVSTAVSSANAIVGMGEQFAGTWPDRYRQADSGDVVRTLLGAALQAMGYHCLRKTAARSGDGVLINESEARYASYRSRYSAYLRRVRQGMSDYGEYDVLTKY